MRFRVTPTAVYIFLLLFFLFFFCFCDYQKNYVTMQCFSGLTLLVGRQEGHRRLPVHQTDDAVGKLVVGPDLSVWKPWAGSLLAVPTHPQMLSINQSIKVFFIVA